MNVSKITVHLIMLIELLSTVYFLIISIFSKSLEKIHFKIKKEIN